jgi:hypothetical protein
LRIFTFTPAGLLTDGSVPIDGIFGTFGIQAMLSGYSSFSQGSYSDHRLLWVDLDLNAILATTTTPLWKPQVRRLQCTNPATVKKFNTIRAKHAKKNNLMYQIERVQEKIKQEQQPDAWMNDLEEIDRVRVKGIKKAEKGCRRLKMGSVSWTPEVKLSMDRISYYQRCRLKYVLKRKINSRTLQKWFKKAKLTHKITSKDEAINSLKDEFKEYSILKNMIRKIEKLLQ